MYQLSYKTHSYCVHICWLFWVIFGKVTRLSLFGCSEFWVISLSFFVFIIQIMWVPPMSTCLDEFWIIVSITQFSDFWVMSYGNWKHILCVFSFHSSVFNGISVIKHTLRDPLVKSTATFDSFFFPHWVWWVFFFFFLHWVLWVWVLGVEGKKKKK